MGDKHFFTCLLIVGSADRHPVGNIITTDNRTAGMHTSATNVSFEHLGILDRIPYQRIGRGFGSLQLRDIFYRIAEIQFLIGNLIGY